MDKKILTHSSTIQTPPFDCYKTVEGDYAKLKPKNAPHIFRLFSTKCKLKECFVMECPIPKESHLK